MNNNCAVCGGFVGNFVYSGEGASICPCINNEIKTYTHQIDIKTNKGKMENLNDKIKFSNGIEASMSELQMLINYISDRDFELACDLLKLWKYNADNLTEATHRITFERQIEYEQRIELKGDD